MHTHRTFRQFGLAFALSLGAALLAPALARAHCDALDGPVVTTARQALQREDVTPVLRWVRPGDEAGIRDAFAKCLAVRALGPEARTLADQFFFETLVRVHRQGEGAPYTGLKPVRSAAPGIAMADQALDKGSIDALTRTLTSEVDRGLRERFARAVETRKNADTSVTAGREYVEAYVAFIHYVEAIHRAAQGAASSNAAEATLAHVD